MNLKALTEGALETLREAAEAAGWSFRRGTGREVWIAERGTCVKYASTAEELLAAVAASSAPRLPAPTGDGGGASRDGDYRGSVRGSALLEKIVKMKEGRPLPTALPSQTGWPGGRGDCPGGGLRPLPLCHLDRGVLTSGRSPKRGKDPRRANNLGSRVMVLVVRDCAAQL